MASCVSFTAPRYTTEQEKAERSDLTFSERLKLEADVFGLETSWLPQAEQSLPRLVEQVEQEVGRYALEQKNAFMQAIERCPDVVIAESHPIKFLRAVEYDPQLAARQILDFWSFRLELFGPERAFLPMTLQGAMADDLPYLEGAWQLNYMTPVRDLKGRKILCCDRSLIDPQRFGRDRLLRQIFYTGCVLARDLETQIRGCVGVIYGPIKSFDRIFFKKWEKLLLGGVLPIKFGAHHSVRNPPMVKYCLPMIKWFLARFDRLKTFIHEGNILVELAPFGITCESLPLTLGGNYAFAETEYVEQRLQEEGGMLSASEMK